MNNRPIKFRVWDKMKQKMSLVAQVQYCDDGYAKTISIVPAPRDYKNHWSVVDGENGELMQFTGLSDVNGKEIYEGDIVSTIYDTQGEVYYHDRIGYRIKLIDNTSIPISIFRCVGDNPPVLINVAQFLLGNIFENPKLMK